MKFREKLGKISFPGWLFVALTMLYHELMLHLWVASPIHWGRVLAVIAFSLGFGGILAFLESLIPNRKTAKWVAVGLSVLMTIIWLTEYFVSDAYRVFMTPKLILGGAGGVAEDYLTLVLSLLGRNLWRIGLMLLPALLYALFCHSTETGWKLRGCIAAAAALAFLLGWGAVNVLTPDVSRFTTTYSFDSAIRCFGLNMGLTLETFQGDVATDSEPSFADVPTLPPEPTETEPEEDPTPTQAPEIVYEDNVFSDWDPAVLAETERNSNIASLHSYVASVTPSKQNEYTGMFAGKNLILITAEAFTAEVIDPELTPTLYRMATQGVCFKDYYQPAWGASTTSGEFSNLMGIVPASGGMCMKETIQQPMFLTMGFQLGKLGYSSVAYHNHVGTFYDRNETHTHLGYDKFVALDFGLEGITRSFPESDLELIDVTVPQYIDQQPFNVYYMTASGHSVYKWDIHRVARLNADKVADLDYSEPVKCYLAANLELENAMTSLIRQLEEAGIADDTLIVISADHYPYGLERSATWKNNADYLAELYGVDKVTKFVRDHNALIMWSGCLEGQDIVIEEPVYSLDILPTLSNLFGVEYDSRLLVGRDVFSEEIPLVLWPDHSWKTDKGTYDSGTGTFTPVDGVEADEDYVKYVSSLVSNKITFSKSVQKYDYYKYVNKVLNPQE